MRQAPARAAALKKRYGTRLPRFRLTRSERYSDRSFPRGTVVQCDVDRAECDPGRPDAFLVAFPDLTLRWVLTDALEPIAKPKRGRRSMP